jgi:hypothetical protein
VREPDGLDEELEGLGLALRRLATPMPPEALVSRVRRLGHLELAGRADEKLNRLVLGFVLFFAWTVNLLGFAAVRFLSGENLLRIATGATLSWSVVYFAFAWISGAAVLILIGWHVRRERGLA